MNVNKCFIGGRLTADPELKQSPSGVSVLRFTVAVDRYKEGTDFIRCVAFRDTAERIARYFQKGSSILIEGNIRVESYTDRENRTRTDVSVVTDRFYFVDKKSEARQSRSSDHPDLIDYDESEDFPF